jgi:signal transduction histidine kinase/DNA-binding response OmpR family regulator/ligand-binding sensor domain-containing protein
MRTINKTACLFLVLSLATATVFYGQKAKFEYFSTENGLAGYNTSTVTQDRQGFIWFINDGKLHRYDGNNFVIQPIPAGLEGAGEALQGVACAEDSLLFVWTLSHYFLFNPENGTAKSFPIKDELGGRFALQPLGHQHIILSELRANYVRQPTIWHFQDHQLSRIPLPVRDSALDATYYWYDEDKEGNIYFSIKDTIYYLNTSGRVLRAISLNNVCANCKSQCFQITVSGDLVIMIDDHFYTLYKGSNAVVPHPVNRFIQGSNIDLHRFVLDHDGNIWACGIDRNLIYYRAQEDLFYNYSIDLQSFINKSDLKNIFIDRTGTVWIDSRLGLLVVRPQNFPFEHYFSEPEQNAYFSFRGITEDEAGYMYGCCYYKGLFRFKPGNKQPYRQYDLVNNTGFFDISADKDRVWLNGFNYINSTSGKLSNVKNDSYLNIGDNGFFARDNKGVLWWASNYILYYLVENGASTHWEKALELPEKVFFKTEALHFGAHSGMLWLSFKGKILQFNPETRQQQWFSFPENKPAVSRILCLTEDASGDLWLGTDVGLWHTDARMNVLAHYTDADGLSNNFICGLLPEGDSCLWLSTNHGLSRFRKSNHGFLNFYEQDGLTYNEFNRMSYFKARDGRMFFGGLRGINAFYPEQIMARFEENKRSSKIVLTSVEWIDERSDTLLRVMNFADQPEIHLHYWDWSYTFSYALTDYRNPKEIIYSYKMEGYKDAWSPPSKFNFVRFNGLPAGTYTFRVQARDGQGRLIPNELAVKIIIYPPWWATWWAYLIYFLIAVGFIYMIYQFFKKRLLLKNQLLKEHEESIRLKELDLIKSRLYTNLTHEFRTPLTVILGMARQIRSEPQKYLDEGTQLIEQNGYNLLHLINQLLDLSKIENNAFQLRWQQGNIVPYLQYVTEAFQTFANGKNLSLRFFSPFEALVMDYDEEQMKQVMTNLISNAVKFTPSGGEISVRLNRENDQFTIEVRDTGIGIAAKHLPHIFDRFYQVNDSNTREAAGTGIGLAHTQELVRLMGGTLQAESEPDKGSIFRIRLPITNQAQTPEKLNEESLVRPIFSAEKYPLSPISNGDKNEQKLTLIQGDTRPQLLIIEDNPDVVIYLKTCLEGIYQIDIAYNGKIGIEKALQNIPDLIICDVMMPEKDGYQVCDTLKNDERSSHIPIILLTAKADADSRITGLKRGADAYLTKPFDKEELLVRLQMLVERQRKMVLYFSKRLFQEPGQTSAIPAPEEAIQIEDAFMQTVREIVEAHYADENFALPQLCQKIRMSRSQLFRKMKAISDLSPSDYIRSYRLNKAKTLLETRTMNVSEVAWKVGYKDLAHFTKSFQEEFGILPSATNK